MTAPDSPAVARLRQMAALSREAANSPDLGEEAAYLDMGADADALDGVLAELDEARREAHQLRAQANCGEGHDPTRICCAHTRDVKRLRRELDEARRQPRVWLEGDEVPAGVTVLPVSGHHAFRTGPGPYRVHFQPLVEAIDYTAVVAAERERRAAEEAS